jgi:hypothetical protein
MTETTQSRVVLVVRAGLAVNQSTNAAAVLGATIGAGLDLPLGAAAEDGSGTRFRGIVTTPIPVLVADGAGLTELFRKTNGDNTVQVACLTEAARKARSYESYLDDLAATTGADEDIVALCIAGPRNRVTKLTKRLALLGDGSQSS